MKHADRIARWRPWIVASAALACGVLAAYAARSYLSEQLALERERLAPRHDTVEVVVAKTDVARGEVIGPATMAIRPIPREYLPGGVVLPEAFEQWAGRRLARPMRSGEPLLATAIEGQEAGSLSSRVRAGIRAMTINVDESNAISGLLRPGDRIDLLFSARPPSTGAPAAEITVPLMQDVLVLATGRAQRAADDAGAGRAFNAITVEVDPRQAQRLLVAQRTGKLTVALRYPDDRRPVPAQPLDLAGLLELPASLAPRPAPELIVGGRGALNPSGERGAPARAGSATAGTPSMPASPIGAAASGAKGATAPAGTGTDAAALAAIAEAAAAAVRGTTAATTSAVAGSATRGRPSP